MQQASVSLLRHKTNKGSNVIAERTKCLDCGKIWSSPVRAKKDPHTCQHTDTYKLGSTADVLRFKCKECSAVDFLV